MSQQDSVGGEARFTSFQNPGSREAGYVCFQTSESLPCGQIRMLYVPEIVFLCHGFLEIWISALFFCFPSYWVVVHPLRSYCHFLDIDSKSPFVTAAMEPLAEQRRGRRIC